MRKLLAIALIFFLYASAVSFAFKVTNVSPNSGLATGGNTVIISGTDLLSVDYVNFGGTQAGKINIQMTVIIPETFTWDVNEDMFSA